MKKYILVLILIIGTASAYAQQKCATIYDASNLTPEIRKSVDNFYDRVESLIQNRETQMAMTYNFNPVSGAILIPVVVHIVHNTTAENISDAQICSQIDILNEDFSRRNPDSNQTPAQFLGVAADTEIQFYLATRDPNDDVTNGITRTVTTTTSFTDDNRVK